MAFLRCSELHLCPMQEASDRKPRTWGSRAGHGLLVVSQTPGPVLANSVLERTLPRCPEQRRGQARWAQLSRDSEAGPQEPCRGALSPGDCSLVSSAFSWPRVGTLGLQDQPLSSLSSFPNHLGCVGNFVLIQFPGDSVCGAAARRVRKFTLLPSKTSARA